MKSLIFKTFISLSHKIYKILNTIESYKILVLDVVDVFYTGDYKDILFVKKYDIRVKNIIENAFSDDLNYKDKDKKMRHTNDIYCYYQKKKDS